MAPLVKRMRLVHSDGSMVDCLPLPGQQAPKQVPTMQPILKAATSMVPGGYGSSGSVTAVKEAAIAAVAVASKKVADAMAAKEAMMEKKVASVKTAEEATAVKKAVEGVEVAKAAKEAMGVKKAAEEATVVKVAEEATVAKKAMEETTATKVAEVAVTAKRVVEEVTMMKVAKEVAAMAGPDGSGYGGPGTA
jgi:hypothetical protein